MTQHFAKALLVVTLATQTNAINIKENLPSQEQKSKDISFTQEDQSSVASSQEVGLAQVGCESGYCSHDYDFWCEKHVWQDLWLNIEATLPECTFELVDPLCDPAIDTCEYIANN